MEISIDLFNNETKKKLLHAQFTMVARDEYGKAFTVPRLLCTTPEEKERHKIFQENLALRKQVLFILILILLHVLILILDLILYLSAKLSRSFALLQLQTNAW